MTVRLEPFRVRHLPLVEPWFEDDETRRRLGDRDWPTRVLALAASPPAGTDRQSFLVRLGHEPVGLIDLELEHGGTASLAIVVAPGRRRAGVAAAVLEAILARAELDGREVRAGVEKDNVAAVRLVERAGFVLERSDRDGFLQYRRAA